MFTSIDPATGTPGPSYRELTGDEIETKLTRAQDAFQEWRVTDYATRTALLERIADTLADRSRAEARDDIKGSICRPADESNRQDNGRRMVSIRPVH